MGHVKGETLETKLNAFRDYLLKNDVFDQDSFVDYIQED